MTLWDNAGQNSIKCKIQKKSDRVSGAFQFITFQYFLKFPRTKYPEVISKATTKNVPEEFSSGTLTCLMIENSLHESEIWDQRKWIITAACTFITYCDFAGADIESEPKCRLVLGCLFRVCPSQHPCWFVIRCLLYPGKTSAPWDAIAAKAAWFQKAWCSNLKSLISYMLVKSI